MTAGAFYDDLETRPAEQRANQWLEWAPLSDALDVVLLGMPFDGASTVRTGSRHAPDAVRQALAYYTTFSTTRAAQQAESLASRCPNRCRALRHRLVT